jgi:hypothetical protein
VVATSTRRVQVTTTPAPPSTSTKVAHARTTPSLPNVTRVAGTPAPPPSIHPGWTSTAETGWRTCPRAGTRMWENEVPTFQWASANWSRSRGCCSRIRQS